MTEDASLSCKRSRSPAARSFRDNSENIRGTLVREGSGIIWGRCRVLSQSIESGISDIYHCKSATHVILCTNNCVWQKSIENTSDEWLAERLTHLLPLLPWSSSSARECVRESCAVLLRRHTLHALGQTQHLCLACRPCYSLHGNANRSGWRANEVHWYTFYGFGAIAALIPVRDRFSPATQRGDQHRRPPFFRGLLLCSFY